MTPMPWPVWRSLRAQAVAESWRLRYSLPGRYPWADLEAYGVRAPARLRDAWVRGTIRGAYVETWRSPRSEVAALPSDQVGGVA